MSNKTEKIGNITLDLDCYSGSDLYSDGDIEDVLLDIAKNKVNKDYETAIDEAVNWPVLYHFSKQRENIVSWLPIRKTDKVLEVGSGCGAITGALANMAGQVTCIDLSKKRSSVNAYRHEDSDNVTIHVGNFLDIEPGLDTDYDYICLIGVFEYGQSYMGSDRPFHKFLEIIKKHVKPDGRIVIAIENKHGLKYFAGCKEDHLGTYFSGIESYPQGGYVRTFSRRGLEKIFNECGASEYHFYYPYPDYKFPTTIFSDKRLPLPGELSNNIRNFDRERLLLFNEKNAFDGIIEDGLFSVFSNSYMAIIGPDVDVDYVRFSNERAAEFAISTVMCDEDGKRVVKKYPLDVKAHSHIEELFNTYQKLSDKYAGSDICVCPCKIVNEGNIPVAVFDYISGQTLTEILDMKAKAGDMEGFNKLILEFRNRIDYNADKNITDLDLVFSNVLVDGDKWTIIDYEWIINEPMDAKYQTYRALYCYSQENEAREKLDFSRCYKELGITSSDIEQYTSIEVDFHKKVQDSHFSLAQMREEIGCDIIRPEKFLGAGAAIEKIERVQIYTDKGQGYSEDNSYFVKKAKYDHGKLTFAIDFPRDVVNLRIDPMMGAGAIFVESLLINGKPLPGLSKKYIECNGRKLRGDMPGYIFETDDPNMNIHLADVELGAENHLEATFTYAYMSVEAAHGILTAAKRLV